MADASGLSNRGVKKPPQEIIEGEIYKTPALDEDVQVVIPDFSEEKIAGPCKWSPQVTTAGLFYPHAGDRCWVGRVGKDERVILAWDRSGDPDAEWEDFLP